MQIRATKMIRGLRTTTYEELLQELDISSLTKKRTKDDMIAVFQFQLKKRGRIVPQSA